MSQVYNCLTVDHDWRLVVLAATVCLLASAVAISLFHRAQATAGRTRLVWITLDAAAAGCGIWATHFIAMLAYAPAVGVSYDLTLTILSLLIAIFITGAGLGLALLDYGRWLPALGGAVVGGGIAAMHYTGMMALELSGHIIWSSSLVLASVSFGVVFGALAFFFATRRNDWTNTTTAIVLLTAAIVAMHFTGMGAVEAMPDPTRIARVASLSPNIFSLLIASVTAIILGMCLVAAFGDRRSEGKLRQQKDLLDTAVENMVQGLCMFDANGHVILFNDNYTRLLGWSAESLQGHNLLDMIRHRKACGEFAGDPDEFVASVIADARKGKSNTRLIKSSAGRALRLVQQSMRKGGWVTTVEDITETLAAQAQISHMAHHDALTDLANRTQLVKKLEGALAEREDGVAVHFIDLDRFKNVNDTLGHDGGDFLLKTIAERLRAATHTDDMVARLGGDEFVVVQTGVNGKECAEEYAQLLSSAMTAPVNFKEHSITPGVSIGVAMAPGDGTNPERLLKSADLALYKAKADGRNCIRFFLPEMDAELQARTKLERIIRDAVEHDRFELHYQPLFEMMGRRLIGFEALVRLRMEDGILIPPLEFIPLAEELRLIDKIGAWILREACRTAATWPDNLTVAVNVSPAQFLTGSISDIVSAGLKEAGLEAHRLELEITENVLLADSKAVMTELKRIKEMGVAIVMDDFGTGYSSLSYLWKFPFDKIKIDRSFMKGFDGSGRDAETVVKTIIALGRELNMRVTVEGVETASQVTFLDNVDSDQAQGFYFGRPVPAAEVAADILANFKTTHQVSSFEEVAAGMPRFVKLSAKR